MRWHAAAYAGPWTSDDPMVHDDGVSIVVEDPRDDALSIDGDAFSCDVVVELRSHGAVIELLDGTIEGRMLAGRPVATIATIRGPSERREACGGWDEGKVPREEEGP